MKMSSILSQSFASLSSGVFLEGTPTYSDPMTLPGWQGLLLLIALVTVVVLALYWNARTYEAPDVNGSHGGEAGQSAGH